MSLLKKLAEAYSFVTTQLPTRIARPQMKVNAAVLGAGVAGHAAYAYGTKRQEIVTVRDKYQIVRNGQTHYALGCANGEQLLLPHSPWYWQWDVPEQWQAAPVGEEILLTTYGYRVPWAGLYKQVVGVHPEP
jgi:hypothetical protein